MADGYVGDPQASADAFRAGWFYPGDVGYLGPERLLAITGREKTQINVGGEKVNPERVEAILTAFPGVSDAAVLAVPNELGIEEIYALVVNSGTVDDQALRAHCERNLQRGLVPVRFLAMDRIPRNEMGKIERSRLIELAKQRPNAGSGPGRLAP